MEPAEYYGPGRKPCALLFENSIAGSEQVPSYSHRAIANVVNRRKTIHVRPTVLLFPSLYMAPRIPRVALIEKETAMSNTATATANVIFDPAIHATDAEGNPVMRKDGTFALKRGRKPGTPNGTTVTRKGFDVQAVSAAYLARVMASGDLNELTRFSMLKQVDKVAFLASTPEYQTTVTDKIVATAAEKIEAILTEAGAENYSAIMELVRFGK